MMEPGSKGTALDQGGDDGPDARTRVTSAALLAAYALVLVSCAAFPMPVDCGYDGETACSVSIIDLIVHPERYEDRHVRFIAPLWLEAASPKGFAAISGEALTLLDAPNIVAVNLAEQPCDIDTEPMIVQGRFSRVEEYNYRGIVLEATILRPVSQAPACGQESP